MALFGFGKKKESEKNESNGSCQCGCCSSKVDDTQEVVNQSNVVKEGACCIKVLGAGCRSCHTLLENTQKAVNELGSPMKVEYVTDMQKIMEYGVMSFPALVVNEKVESVGKVLKSEDIIKLLKKLGY